LHSPPFRSPLCRRPNAIGIRPQSPEGKGIVVLKAARLIDGTGAPAITNAVVIVTDNKSLRSVMLLRCAFLPAQK